VGYKNHSEVGWVLREYNELMDEAHKIGIGSPEGFYNDGKTKGKSGRDKGLCEASVKKNIEAGKTSEKGTDLSDFKEEDKAVHLFKKTPRGGIPDLLEKISMVEIPKCLYGIKFFHKK
jgi:hypothetical protein